MTQKKNTTTVYYVKKPKNKRSAQKIDKTQPAQTPKATHVNRPTPKHFFQQINVFFLKKIRESMKLRVCQNASL